MEDKREPTPSAALPSVDELLTQSARRQEEARQRESEAVASLASDASKGFTATPEHALGRELKRLREAKGMSQEQVSRLMDIYDRGGPSWKQTTVAKTEAGSRPIRVNELIGFTRVFDVSLTDLIASVAYASDTYTPQEDARDDADQHAPLLYLPSVETLLAQLQLERTLSQYSRAAENVEIAEIALDLARRSVADCTADVGRAIAQKEEARAKANQARNELESLKAQDAEKWRKKRGK
jgi:transcriptional regulator with XRE-family HTH domain